MVCLSQWPLDQGFVVVNSYICSGVMNLAQQLADNDEGVITTDCFDLAIIIYTIYIMVIGNTNENSVLATVLSSVCNIPKCYTKRAPLEIVYWRL